MFKWLAGVGAAMALALAGVVALVAVAVAAIVGGGTGGASSGGAGASTGTTGSAAAEANPAIPSAWLTLYQQAARTCTGLPWTVLAAIGTVESDNGTSRAPGVWSGANPAGAEGPMQFKPATFAAYATVGPQGASPPSPYDPTDAVYSAAALLCANGAGSAASLRSAITDYNHSDSYVDTVSTLALAYGDDPQISGSVVEALSFAAQQLGTPYRWGGTGAGGFDCSGLVQAAYRAAGVSLPRVAQDQYDAGPAVAPGSSVLPGDLVFFGAGASQVEHVGMYVGAGEMIDAPYTGALVRFDRIDGMDLVGATRPTG
jgi:cell wall-associated NlpC family hydrolase